MAKKRFKSYAEAEAEAVKLSEKVSLLELGLFDLYAEKVLWRSKSVAGGVRFGVSRLAAPHGGLIFFVDRSGTYDNLEVHYIDDFARWAETYHGEFSSEVRTGVVWAKEQRFFAMNPEVRGTITGRMSSTTPNVHDLPRRSDESKAIIAAFVKMNT